jgi:hypothetical protein
MRRIPELRLSEIAGSDTFLSSEMLDALKLRTNAIAYYKDNIDYSRVGCHDLKAEALPANSSMADAEGLCFAPSQLDDYLKDWVISGPELVKTSATHWVCSYRGRGDITLTFDRATTLEQFGATKAMHTSLVIVTGEPNFYGFDVHERRSLVINGWRNGAAVSVEAQASLAELVAIAKALLVRL